MLENNGRLSVYTKSTAIRLGIDHECFRNLVKVSYLILIKFLSRAI